MSLKERILADIKSSMREGEKKRMSVLRMLLSELQYAQTSGTNEGDLEDDAVQKVIIGYHKRLNKSLKDYPEGEKKEEIKAEISYVEDYMPKRATDAEIDAVVGDLLGSSDERNFGILMKMTMAKLGPAADGQAVSRILKKKLAS